MSTIRETKLPKDSGRDWQRKADAAWQRANGDMRYWRRHRPDLPAWPKPEHVARDALGHYLLDRDTNVVHSVRHAVPECELDKIKNGTFVHFAHELRELHPDAEACPRCLP